MDQGGEAVTGAVRNDALQGGNRMIIDTHLHIIDLDALHYPWLGSVEALNRMFRYETYAAEARKVGIAATLHMEVDVAEEEIVAESDYISGLAAQPGSLLVGAIASCRPEQDGFARYLDLVREKAIVKGFRRVLHVMPDDLSESALFRENIKRLSGTGLTFDLCVLPHQMERAIALVDLAPDVTFIVDHCGVPDIKGGNIDGWKTGISEIARRPNVIGKLSGISIYGDGENWSVETLRPYAEHTIDSFGFDRMVWGSDWPVCTLAGSLSTWVAATHALLSGVSPDDKAKLLSGNARKLWNLSV